MTFSKILDKILPYTKEDLKCNLKKQKKGYQRNKLMIAITKYKSGRKVNWDEHKINIDELFKLLNNEP